MRELQADFDRLGPWRTKFDFDGRSYGGAFDAANDGRLVLFKQHFPDPNKRVLELGSMEGGHTVEIAKHSRHVTAIEGRNENRHRAELIAQITNTRNLQFRDGNLETLDPSPLGIFDVCFNVGLLYHIPEPWLLLARLARCCKAMFLWTHIGVDRGIHGEYRGEMYREFGRSDPLSGLSPESFWPTHDELLRMLVNNGFVACETIQHSGNSCIIKCESTFLR